jgi:hypothetical protein
MNGDRTGTATNGAHAAPLEAVTETTLGDPVEGYAEPMDEAAERDYDARLDAIEPAHTAAAAKLRELFAG